MTTEFFLALARPNPRPPLPAARARPVSLLGALHLFRRPVISGDPEIGSTARRATGAALPHQRLSALCSPHFLKGAESDQRHPAPSMNRPAKRWLDDNSCKAGKGAPGSALRAVQAQAP